MIERGVHGAERWAIALMIAVTLLMPSAPACAHGDVDVSAVRAELAVLKARIAELEARLAAGTPVPGKQAAPENVPPRPDPVRSVTAGGRIKLDVIFNSQSAGGGSANRADVALSPGDIPISGNGEDDQTKFSARNSRLWVKALTPTRYGDAAAYLELDFFAAGNGNESVTSSHEPRLRHGYGQWRGWLAGQTYSTAINLGAYPEINDDGGPPGVLLVRQPMLRWRGERAGHSFAVALESPDSLVRDRNGRRLAPDDERWPDLALRYEQRHRWGHVSLGALAREIRIDDRVAEDAAFGGAVSVSGEYRFENRDDLRFMLNAGNAIGRYLGGGFFDDARIGRDGKLELASAAGGYLAYRHWWSRIWRSNLVVGGAWMDPDGALAEETEHSWSMHANLLWSPALHTTLGLEWIHAERTRVDGRDGSLDRLQFTAIHQF